LIRGTPQLDWMLLTKRPENIVRMLPADWGAGWFNIWLGTTA
jgi:protein gp37